MRITGQPSIIGQSRSGRKTLFVRDRPCKKAEPITLLVANGSPSEEVFMATLFAHEEGSPRRHLDFLHDGIPGASSVDLLVTTSETFCGRLFVVPKSVVDGDFLVEQITVDGRPQMVSESGVPARVFAEDTLGMSLALDHGTRFTLRVRNLASFPRPFGLRMHP